MPKPARKPAPKKRSYSTNTGVTNTTDVEQSHKNADVIRRRTEAAENTRVRDRATSGAKIDRMSRQTDTGHTKRAKQNRIKSYKLTENKLTKRERYTDTGTSRSAKKTYGNAETTKRVMQSKYGNARRKASAKDRIDYKGKEIERKVRQNWKPSDVSSSRPGETGREWDDHKYIDKVRTKSGKIRYIYAGSGGGTKDANTTRATNKASGNASKARAFVRNLFGR